MADEPELSVEDTDSLRLPKQFWDDIKFAQERRLWLRKFGPPSYLKLVTLCGRHVNS